RVPAAVLTRGSSRRGALKLPELRVRTSERPFSRVGGIVVRSPTHHRHLPTVGDHRFRAQIPPFRPRSTRSTLKFVIFRTVSTSSREPDGRFRRAGGARWALKWPLLRVRTSERPFSPVCGLVVRRPPHHPHPPK